MHACAVHMVAARLGMHALASPLSSPALQSSSKCVQRTARNYCSSRNSERMRGHVIYRLSGFEQKRQLFKAREDHATDYLLGRQGSSIPWSCVRYADDPRQSMPYTFQLRHIWKALQACSGQLEHVMKLSIYHIICKARPGSW